MGDTEWGKSGPCHQERKQGLLSQAVTRREKGKKGKGRERKGWGGQRIGE